VKLGEGKIYSLAYADDVLLIAEKKEEIKSMLERWERYVEGKNMEVNVEKTKIMRFRWGGGRWMKMDWRWKGKKIEEVKKFKYLGYMLQRNGGQEAHIRERIRRAAVIMDQVWGIGKRRFGSDWGRRIWLFDKLVWTVLSYGVEIWGWKERDSEKIEERYLKWILGVDVKTPSYLVREELQRQRLRGRAERRAWAFKKRMEEGRRSEIGRKCWYEMRKRCREEKIASEKGKGRKGIFRGKRDKGKGNRD